MCKCVCVTAGDEYSVKWKKINQSTCHLFVMICLILVWYVQRWMMSRVCVCVWWGNRAHRRARERETEIESVCLDQLHSKSVYSAQFGIKHNRLLSACYRLWLPIKMEFIAALRASPNYTFFPLHSVLFPLSHLHSFLFHGCSNSGSVGCFFPLISSSSCQTSRHNSSL